MSEAFPRHVGIMLTFALLFAVPVMMMTGYLTNGAHGQSVSPNTHCQPIWPEASLSCGSCSTHVSPCSNMPPSNYVNGICEPCSGCGGLNCNWYGIWDCGQERDCTTGLPDGHDCLAQSPSLGYVWCQQ